jgi:hypothetical protein
MCFSGIVDGPSAGAPATRRARAALCLTMTITACAGHATPEVPGPAPAASTRAGEAAPQTRAERTGYTETSHYADVIEFLDAMTRRRYPIARGSIGTTSEGRAIPYVIASRPLVSTPAQARALGRPIVYVQANIHAGEVEGKEALLAVIRDLVTSPRRNALDSIVLIAVPIYNADGNEKFAPQAQNRGAQNGPELVGVRPNGKGLDLNRDYIKAEAPETRASLRMFNTWDPDVFVDLHTTDGSYHGYALTYSPSLHPLAYTPEANDKGTFTRDELLPELRRRLRSRHGFEIFDYGNFASNDSVEKGWSTYEHKPRYGTNYFGLRGRVSILSEAYSHDPFERRVKSTYAFVSEVLSLVAERADRVRARPQETEQHLAAGAAAHRALSVRAQLTRSPHMDTVVAETLERTTDQARTEPGVRAGTRRTGKMRAVRMPVFDRFESTLDERLPWGYVLAPTDTVGLRLLETHGVIVEETHAACSPALDEFSVDSASLGRLFQEHREARVFGSWRRGEGATSLPSQSRVIRVAQPLGLIAMIMLEPQSDDGLVDWNLGDRVVEQGGRAQVSANLGVRRLMDPLPSSCQLRRRAGAGPQ